MNRQTNPSARDEFRIQIVSWPTDATAARVSATASHILAVRPFLPLLIIPVLALAP
jgi:hypothetical protein